jgi:hypothetical protein
MRIMTGVATLAVLSGLAAAPAQAEPAAKAMDALKAGALPTTYTQFRGYGGWHRGGFGGWRGGYGGWRGGYGYRRGPGVGAAVGAGLLGFTAGAVIGSAAANAAARPVAVYEAPAPVVYARPVAVRGSAYCAARYGSYDPASGTYLGYDGFRHPCP